MSRAVSFVIFEVEFSRFEFVEIGAISLFPFRGTNVRRSDGLILADIDMYHRRKDIRGVFEKFVEMP